MGLDVDDYLFNELDEDNFRVIEYAVRELADDIYPVLKMLIPENQHRLLMDLEAVITILNTHCLIIDEQIRRAKARKAEATTE